MGESDVGSTSLAELPLPELLSRSRALAAELSSRLTDPRLVDHLPRLRTLAEDHDHPEDWGLYCPSDALEPVHSGQGALEDPEDLEDPDVGEHGDGHGRNGPPPGSLPEVQVGVEELARVIDAARTALAGHTDRVFESHGLREELLGIPPGKCAFRNGTEYLRELLRIGRREAKARVSRAAHTMETLTLDHTTVVEASMPALAEAVRHAELGGTAVDLITTTVAEARREAVLAEAPPGAVDELLVRGEELLVTQARDLDPDTLRKVCEHWRLRFEAAVNPDGAEPTEAQLNATQGLFYRGEAKGLHQWHLWADDAQHEMLKTVASEGSSPRRNSGAPGVSSDAGGPGISGNAGGPGVKGENGPRGAMGGNSVEGTEPDGGSTKAWSLLDDHAATLDGRSRARRELDSLVSALTGALALVGVGTGTGSGTVSGTVSGTGSGTYRTRPQVMTVIDYETLIERFGQDPPETGMDRRSSDGPAPPRLRAGRISSSSYVGEINPRSIRRLACEADLIPVVLGGSGEVLDVGRSRRLFTPRLRRAITARDGGCTAPGCSIPAPWCEAHHIRPWEDSGPTSVDNGTLLCSHHHHAVHAGAWSISVRQGIPWFVPARYLDPARRPRRNLYWRPGLAA
ncbi:MAG: DUF222 domain-containing protein [Citricoccus sp.]